MASKHSDFNRIIASMDKKLARIERRLAVVTNLLSDASQKLCHLIKRQREQRAQGYGED